MGGRRPHSSPCGKPLYSVAPCENLCDLLPQERLYGLELRGLCLGFCGPVLVRSRNEVTVDSWVGEKQAAAKSLESNQ